jgi:N-acetyl-D-muramate 6-phosphate phosphatase
MKLVLFDLDGTLIDSALDLGWALNTLLMQANQSPIAIEKIRPWVSGGAGVLIRQGFGIDAQHPDYELLKRQLVGLYAENSLKQTVIFDGIDEVLISLEKQGLLWGIVTNKMGWLTDPIVRSLGWEQRSICTISGDTLPQQKPDPAQLLHACALANIAPADGVYVGDAITDIQAGQRAGMRTLVAAYGYLADDDTPEHWGAEALLSKPTDLLDWLGKIK